MLIVNSKQSGVASSVAWARRRASLALLTQQILASTLRDEFCCRIYVSLSRIQFRTLVSYE